LLKAAIRCDDPVVFMEHKELMATTGEVSDDADEIVPIGKARIVREGSYLTIVAWSKAALLAAEAAELLASNGISAEVIDLRSLWPWDKDAVYTSVAKTGRLLVAQEAVQVGGFGAEIAADVAENLGDVLKTHVRRIGAPRIPVPYSEPMENEYRVTAEKIAAKAKEVVA
jgi:pyruvate dehydrogenase E1 component beta subunit